MNKMKPYRFFVVLMELETSQRSLILWLWNCFCIASIVKDWKEISDNDKRLLGIYFEPYVPFCAMLWLWSLNVRCFERMGIGYQKLFGNEDSKALVKSEALMHAALALTTLVSTFVALFVFSCSVQVPSANIFRARRLLRSKLEENGFLSLSY